MHTCAPSDFSHAQLFFIPMDCSLSGSSVHGIIPEKILEWAAIFSFRGSSRLREQTHISYTSCIGRWILYHWATLEAPFRIHEVKWSEITQLCLTLCDPMDCSLPGFSVHGIFQARILEWVAISFSSQTTYLVANILFVHDFLSF